jgi:hypothetical protein
MSAASRAQAQPRRGAGLKKLSRREGFSCAGTQSFWDWESGSPRRLPRFRGGDRQRRQRAADAKGDRIDHRLDHKGARIERRLDERGDRIDRRRGGLAD